MKYLTTEDAEAVTSVKRKTDGVAGFFPINSYSYEVEAGLSLPWSPIYSQLLIGCYALVGVPGEKDLGIFFSKRTTGSEDDFTIMGSVLLPAGERKVVFYFPNDITHCIVTPSDEFVVATIYNEEDDGEPPQDLTIQYTTERGV